MQTPNPQKIEQAQIAKAGATAKIDTESARAEQLRASAAKDNAIQAAAATTDNNPFAKFPAWVAARVARCEGAFLDAGCGYGRN